MSQTDVHPDMQAAVAAFDWASTPLGKRDTWPTSLRNAVDLMLACKLPMYIAWGPSFTQIYNDAYRPILGDKHPALGSSARETWPEIWPTIGPMWSRVLAGESIGSDNFKLTINRFGYFEDCWFSFSYSPVKDDSGQPYGVLVTFAETTPAVRAAAELQAERSKLQLALEATNVGWWHYEPVTDTASWDPRFAEIFGLEGTSGPNSDPFGRLLEEDREPVWEAVKAALDPARQQRFSVEYRVRHPRNGIRWIEAHGVASFAAGDKETKATSLVGTVADITEARATRQALAESESSARRMSERLALALQSTRMGDWSWDATSDMVTMSERAAAIFGIPPGPHMTWTAMRELLHPEDRERAQQAVERAVSEHVDYSVDYRVVKPDAETWVFAQGRAIYDDAGAVTGMLGMIQDITERKALEATLKTRSETLEVLNRTGAAIVGELDVHRLVSTITDAATKLSGAQFGAFFYNVLDARGESYMLYSLSGVPRSHFEHFPMPRATMMFGPTFRGESPIRIANVKKDPRYGKADTYHGMPPGHLPVVSYLAVPVISRSGEVLGGLFFGHKDEGVFTQAGEDLVASLAAQAAIAIDNSRLHERANRNREAAETANRMKDEFLATVSHELRTPLTSMVGWVHMMRTGKLSEDDQRKALEIIDRNVKAQQQIIEDILDVSRIVTGKVRLELSPTDAVAAVQAAIDALMPLMESRRIRLVRMFETSVMVLGDASRLQQIAWNLISNAIKYTPKEGKISVAVRRVDSHVAIAFTDTGEGIDPAFLPHVFERFRQADSSTTRAHGGIGLGLSIVRHLVELHGGKVYARSEGIGKGSEFVVELPIAAATAAVATSPLPATMHSPVKKDFQPSAAAAASLTELDAVTVLVVDDEPDTRHLIETVLSRAGAKVETASSAEEALGKVGRLRPHVIVSDIGMPREDGYSLLNRLRKLPPEHGGATPAAALTAYARSEDRLKCLAAGYQIHMPKPVNPVELVAVVASLAGKRPPRED